MNFLRRSGKGRAFLFCYFDDDEKLQNTKKNLKTHMLVLLHECDVTLLTTCSGMAILRNPVLVGFDSCESTGGGKVVGWKGRGVGDVQGQEGFK